MTVAEMSRIDRTIEINAPPERVFRALTRAEEVSTWFRMIIEGDMIAGQEVWMTATQPGYEGMRFPVRIREITAPRRVVWEWHPGETCADGDFSREPRTTVTFTLEAIERGTRLTVSETGFDAISLERRAKAYQDNTQGWTEVVVWLKNYVEEAR